MVAAPFRIAAVRPTTMFVSASAVLFATIITLLAAVALRAIDAAAAEAGQADQIYTIDIAGGGPTRLAGAAGQRYWGVAWSPDGRRLAFTVIGIGRTDGQLIVANADGSDLRPLTHNGRVNYLPAWSPDGTRIVFLSQPGSDETHADLYLIDADGSNERRLTTNDAQEYGASWSPDGRRIVFGSKRDGTWQLYTMNADGRDQALLPGTGGGNAPAWSPDGRQIAFKSDRSGHDNIYLVNADGTDVRRLTTGPHIDNSPVWSPDGKRIAFTSDRNGKNDLFVMDADGSGQVNLTSGAPLSVGVPAWSPDGRRIAFHASDAGLAATWRPRLLRAVVLTIHAALVMLILFGVTFLRRRTPGLITAIAVVAGLVLASLLGDTMLLIVVPAAGIVADVLAWVLRPSVARPGASRAASMLVPVALYGIPLLALSRVNPAAFPPSYLILLTLAVGLAGLGAGLLACHWSQGRIGEQT